MVIDSEIKMPCRHENWKVTKNNTIFTGISDPVIIILKEHYK